MIRNDYRRATKTNENQTPTANLSNIHKQKNKKKMPTHRYTLHAHS